MISIYIEYYKYLFVISNQNDTWVCQDVQFVFVFVSHIEKNIDSKSFFHPIILSMVILCNKVVVVVVVVVKRCWIQVPWMILMDYLYCYWFIILIFFYYCYCYYYYFCFYYHWLIISFSCYHLQDRNKQNSMMHLIDQLSILF